MTELESEAMEAEFDTVAGWTEEAVRALGPEYAIPAGCRGSGSEGALRWLADRLALAPGRPGCSTPARASAARPGWLAAERGVRPVCAEPMAAAVRAGRRLFGLPVGGRAVAGAAVRRRLVRRGLVPRACCARRRTRPALLAELRRVLRPRRPARPAGVRRRRAAAPAPARGQRVPVGGRGARRCCATAGFAVDAAGRRRPGRQSRGVDRAGRRRGRRGAAPARGRPGLPAGAGEVRRVGRLLSDGALRAWLGVARRPERRVQRKLAKNSLHS